MNEQLPKWPKRPKRLHTETDEQFDIRFSEYMNLKIEWKKVYNRTRKKEQYALNRERINEKRRQDKKSNPSKFKRYDDNYKQKLKQDEERSELRRFYMSKYHRERKSRDVNFALAATLRRSLGDKLKRYSSTGRENSATNLIGCTLQEFIIYIEKKFVDGMTWAPKNFHLDHIKPCSSFDLTNPEQVKECFHYTNFQPLWPKENMQKHAKIDWNRQINE